MSKIENAVNNLTEDDILNELDKIPEGFIVAFCGICVGFFVGYLWGHHSGYSTAYNEVKWVKPLFNTSQNIQAT